MPVGIGLTEYHYYILHKDSLTIMSLLTESVVENYDLTSMGRVLRMEYDALN